MKVAQPCPTLGDPMDHTFHGLLQVRILEWVAIPFYRGSSQPRDPTQVSHIAGGFFTSWATREAQNSQYFNKNKLKIKKKSWPLKSSSVKPWINSTTKGKSTEHLHHIKKQSPGPAVQTFVCHHSITTCEGKSCLTMWVRAGGEGQGRQQGWEVDRAPAEEAAVPVASK